MISVCLHKYAFAAAEVEEIDLGSDEKFHPGAERTQ